MLASVPSSTTPRTMAILEEVPGVQVFVQVKGRIATEYPNPDSQQQQQERTPNGCPVVDRYIESFDNGHFAIVTEVGLTHDFNYKNHALSFHVYVDGRYKVNNCTSKEYVWAGAGRRTVPGPVMLDEKNGKVVQRRLKFSSVTTVEDDQGDRVKRDKKKAKNLGVIEVQVFRIVLREVTSFQTGKATRRQDLELSEKALKGKVISHGASYGRLEASVPARNYESDDIPEDGGPIAVYRFFYRSREALKQELIIPRSPSPPALQAVASVPDRNVKPELVGQRPKDEPQGPSVKRELSEVLDQIPNSPELRMGKRPRRREQRVEVIDLTMD
ncbi:hypothetical protein PG985_001621 [Apiospora marii]|uniref:uncharacterized protein n=1 Tax=Apiospora marii TaxID=335849 RepID=UPI00313139F9